MEKMAKTSDNLGPNTSFKGRVMAELDEKLIKTVAQKDRLEFEI